MNAVVKNICRMLESSDPEMQAAAAKVLGELRPDEPEVYRIIGELLSTQNHALKTFLLEAIEKGERQESLPHLLPLLDDENLRDRVARAIIALGPSTLVELKRRYADGPLPVKRSVIAILTRMPSPPTLNFLVDLLLNEQVEVIKYLCFKMKMEVERYEDKDRKLVLSRLLKLFQSPEMKRNRMALIGALKLLGDLKDPSGKKVILQFISNDFDTGIRVTAFHALMHLDLGKGKHEDLVTAILPVLDEKDFPSIVSNALNVIQRVQFPKALRKDMKPNLKSPHPDVRRYAIRTLADMETPGLVKLLVDSLDDPDFRVRDDAVAALGQAPGGGAKEIFAKIAKTTDLPKIRQLAPLLRGQMKSLDKAAVTRLRTKFLDLFESGDGAAVAYFELFELIDAPGTAKALIDRSKKQKAKRKFDKALRYFEPIRDKEYLSDAGRLELASLLLKTGKKSFNRSDRHADPALVLLGEIIRSNNVDLFALLKRQANFLKTDDFYYVGYHFAEKDGEEKEFGAKLLGYLAKKSPKSKYGKLARNKMNIESIP